MPKIYYSQIETVVMQKLTFSWSKPLGQLEKFLYEV